jgi:hypothetical protein
MGRANRQGGAGEVWDWVGAKQLSTKRNSPDLPWYFRPWPVIGITIGGPIIVIILASGGSIISLVANAIWIPFALFPLSWSYLLYSYLSPCAKETSRHRSGRNKILFILLITSLAIAGLLTAFGLNTSEPNEPADLILFPIFFAFLVLNWRASDLLVELEGREIYKAPAPVFRSFLAIFYLPFFIGWFSNRLRRLKRAGKI